MNTRLKLGMRLLSKNTIKTKQNTFFRNNLVIYNQYKFSSSSSDSPGNGPKEAQYRKVNSELNLKSTLAANEYISIVDDNDVPTG